MYLYFVRSTNTGTRTAVTPQNNAAKVWNRFTPNRTFTFSSFYLVHSTDISRGRKARNLLNIYMCTIVWCPTIKFDSSENLDSSQAAPVGDASRLGETDKAGVDGKGKAEGKSRHPSPFILLVTFPFPQ